MKKQGSEGANSAEYSKNSVSRTVRRTCEWMGRDKEEFELAEIDISFAGLYTNADREGAT